MTEIVLMLPAGDEGGNEVRGDYLVSGSQLERVQSTPAASITLSSQPYKVTDENIWQISFERTLACIECKAGPNCLSRHVSCNVA